VTTVLSDIFKDICDQHGANYTDLSPMLHASDKLSIMLTYDTVKCRPHLQFNYYAHWVLDNSKASICYYDLTPVRRASQAITSRPLTIETHHQYVCRKSVCIDCVAMDSIEQIISLLSARTTIEDHMSLRNNKVQYIFKIIDRHKNEHKPLITSIEVYLK
jgi:hypothetical protein